MNPKEKSTNINEKTSVVKELSNQSLNIVNMSDSARIEQLTQTLLKQTVTIEGKKEETLNENGSTIARTTTEDGSGVIVDISDKVYIVTNYHVVDSMEKISLTFNNDETATASILGYDEFFDVAVLTVPFTNSLKQEIEPVTFGNSDYAKLGEMVIAIGNALGHGQSVTVGYISALDREVTAKDGNKILLQTDAAINPGNSGGALINLNGELIGINVSKYTEENVERMSFAIPSNDVNHIVSNIIGKNLPVSNNIGDLGLYGMEITEDYQDEFQTNFGIYITKIQNYSIISQSGLQVGDVLISVNNIEVKTFDDLHQAIQKNKNKLKLTYQRLIENEWKEYTLTIKFT